MTTAWTAAHLASLDSSGRQAPVIDPVEVAVITPGLWFWDFWPALDEAGRSVSVEDGELWFALSAPCSHDPLERHAVARIRVLHRRGSLWRDLGDAMPDGWSPGSREWSGSAIIRGDTLTLWFTAAGRRGEAITSYEQRLFEARATIASGPRLGAWTLPVELVRSDGGIYDLAREASGTVGTIKAFRDPAWFRDPADGAVYMVFTASHGRSQRPQNGVVGIARGTRDGWALMNPLVSADGVNNELERPHIIMSEGRYLLFWSTQASVFAEGIRAPTGLYGMTAERIAGPWQPLGGDALVMANPQTAPQQAYSWLVGGDGVVSSFVDNPAGTFVGAFAPPLLLALPGLL